MRRMGVTFRAQADLYKDLLDWGREQSRERCRGRNRSHYPRIFKARARKRWRIMKKEESEVVCPYVLIFVFLPISS
jgi:hypothetical protein